MGWTCIYKPQDPYAEVMSLFTWPDSVPFTAEIVKVSKVGSTYYVACKKTPKPGKTMETYGHVPDPEDGSITFAAIILTRKDRNGDFCYKDMDEGMGPYEAKAPLSFLKLLSPTTKDYANNWRDRCRKYAARPRPKIGDTVRLHKTWEPYGDLFEKIEWYGQRGVYRSVKTGDPVLLRTAEIKEIVK